MVRETREKIIEAFFSLAMKSPEKCGFTMTDIAKEAGISRQAIYQKHFYDTDDIVQYVHQTIDDKIFGIFQRYNADTDGDLFEYVADFVLPSIYEKRKWIRCLYTTNIDPAWKDFLVATYSKCTQAILPPTQAISRLDNEATISLTVKMTLMIIETWMSEEEPLTPEQFKPIFMKLVQTPLAEYLHVK